MSWQDLLRLNFTSWEKLADFLELSSEQREALLASPQFSLNVPLRLASKMQKGSLTDPLFLQFVALKKELEEKEGFSDDPVQDHCFQKTPRLLQKYRSRALLISTGGCAMNCRFCFRQAYPYEAGEKEFHRELASIASDSSIDELILSGGDPLSLSNRVLKMLLERAAAIPHLKRLRFHTRFPIGIPERIDEDFLSILAECPLQIYFVLHSNHPAELDLDVLEAMRKLKKIGVQLLSHTVLLKGVNDSKAVLEELFRTLSNNGILSYYLHQLDKVRGAAHFEVSKEEGLLLMKELQAVLPGYAVPKYVQEIPFAESKVLLS